MMMDANSWEEDMAHMKAMLQKRTKQSEEKEALD